jgi:hypothetical protein
MDFKQFLKTLLNLELDQDDTYTINRMKLSFSWKKHLMQKLKEKSIECLQVTWHLFKGNNSWMEKCG